MGVMTNDSIVIIKCDTDSGIIAWAAGTGIGTYNGWCRYLCQGNRQQDQTG